ncbi:hypothetical protein Chor_005112 [Crotalus horridus]
MSGVREVVTLQLGHYASSVGSHWWGLQEALFLSNSTASDLDEVIQHDVLFRTGRTLQGRETFTPRLILMDLKESLAALKQEGYLYEDPKNNIPVAWARGFPTVISYLRPSLLVKKKAAAAHQAAGIRETCARLVRLPPYQSPSTEHPDHPRIQPRGGFQLLCDLHNGFSGLGSKAAELLQDEYAGKSILACGLTPLPHRNFYRLMNTALGIVRLASHSSLFCPLSLNGNLGLKLDGPVALPYVHYENQITPPKRDISPLPQVAEASAALPFPVAEDQSLPDALYSQQPSTAWCPLSSCGNRGDAGCFAQSVVLRGIGKRQQVSNAPPGTEPQSILHTCETGQEILAHYLHTVSPRTLSTSLLLQGPCKLLAPYPQFFSPFLNKHGFLSKKPSRSPAQVESLPVLAAFQSSAGLYQTLGDVYRKLHGTDLRRWVSFFSTGMETDDFQEALDELRTLSLCYKKGSLDENSDSDDTD